LADVDAMSADSASCEFVGVPTGPTSDIENVHTGLKPEPFDDSVDFLDRSLSK
jgi:hypothetical protein